MCSWAVASSELPDDDQVVDTGLFSSGVTPTSGSAGASRHAAITNCPPSVQRTSFRSRDSLARRSPPWTHKSVPAAIRQVIAGATGHTYARRRLRPAVPLCPGGHGPPQATRSPCVFSLSANSGTLRVRPAPSMWVNRNFGELQAAIVCEEGLRRGGRHWQCRVRDTPGAAAVSALIPRHRAGYSYTPSGERADARGAGRPSAEQYDATNECGRLSGIKHNDTLEASSLRNIHRHGGC